jgi:hypothetical protein
MVRGWNGGLAPWIDWSRYLKNYNSPKPPASAVPRLPTLSSYRKPPCLQPGDPVIARKAASNGRLLIAQRTSWLGVMSERIDPAVLMARRRRHARPATACETAWLGW